MTEDREAKIRRRAHELWEEQGRPEGRETEFWLQAEREVGITRTGGRRKKAAMWSAFDHRSSRPIPTSCS
jgi:hypothetical protein